MVVIDTHPLHFAVDRLTLNLDLKDIPATERPHCQIRYDMTGELTVAQLMPWVLVHHGLPAAFLTSPVGSVPSLTLY